LAQVDAPYTSWNRHGLSVPRRPSSLTLPTPPAVGEERERGDGRARYELQKYHLGPRGREEARGYSIQPRSRANVCGDNRLRARPAGTTRPPAPVRGSDATETVSRRARYCQQTGKRGPRVFVRRT